VIDVNGNQYVLTDEVVDHKPDGSAVLDADQFVVQPIDGEPAFAWWVPYTLRKRNWIIAAVSKQYIKRTHKFGIKVLKTIKRVLGIDEENGNSL